jgi:hypothetical protein
MLTPKQNTQIRCNNENLPGNFLQVRYAFALPLPATFSFFFYLKNWFSGTQRGFNFSALRDVDSFIHPEKQWQHD